MDNDEPLQLKRSPSEEMRAREDDLLEKLKELEREAGISDAGGPEKLGLRMARLPSYLRERLGLQALQFPDEDEVIRRAFRSWIEAQEIEKQRSKQVIEFHRGPACLVFFGDHHFGNERTNYPLAFEEAALAVSMPNTVIGLLGDMLDQFFIGRLIALQMNTRIRPKDEWVILRRYLRMIAEKVMMIVPGNHGMWLEYLVGIPYFQEVVASFSPSALYDADQIDLSVKIGNQEWPGRLRHIWRYHSMYNPTHGIEQGARFDGSFIWGVGAHRHCGAYVREFCPEEKGSGVAAVVGTYKELDGFARRGGFPVGNRRTAIALIFDDESGSIFGTSDLGLASRLMWGFFPDGDTPLDEIDL